MEKILVYNTAADSGGAMTVLNSFYEKCCADTAHEYYFVLGLASFPETDHVHMIRLPWTKRSWFHRLYCDSFFVQKLIRQYHIDRVLSLQNIGIPRCQKPQTVFVQNAIPFAEFRFSFRRERYYWIYQNIIGALTLRSLRKADHIIVQTDWMKSRISQKCGVDPTLITVERPVISKPQITNRIESEHPVFFYPTAAYTFKNVGLIIDACKQLPKEAVYDVFITITGEENDISRGWKAESETNHLPIHFIGRIDREEVNQFYRKSVLVFPSYLETVGLPLLEAQQFDCPVLAADCGYARDMLAGYQNAAYFDYTFPDQLASLMQETLKKESHEYLLK